MRISELLIIKCVCVCVDVVVEVPKKSYIFFVTLNRFFRNTLKQTL